MSLSDLNIKTEYRTPDCNLVQSFYLPVLKEAQLYQRCVGRFSSSALIDLSKGIAEMTNNGGVIQIIASPDLDDEELKAIELGYKKREEIIEESLIKKLDEEALDYFSIERLNLLANLIADSLLDIKIAYVVDDSKVSLYEEKFGIISDSTNAIAFSGLADESLSSLEITVGSVDVFCDWKSDTDKAHVEDKIEAFKKMWENTASNLKVKSFSRFTQKFIEKYRKHNPDYEIDKKQFPEAYSKPSSCDVAPEMPSNDLARGARLPSPDFLYPYQNDAISVWVSENYRGIFDMATGTGKTYTGLGAIAKLSVDLNDELAVIIVAPYQHLVEQWVEDILKFNMKPIIAYSKSPQKDWKNRLSNAVRDQRLRSEKSFFCLVCTNATFASEYVQNEIDKIKKPILLVVDEAHNFGAPSYSILLDERFKYRLALSATLDRHGDEVGTAVLYDFFGKKCYTYSLEQAIHDKKLTRYKYFPVCVYLNDDELESYDKLSVEISRNVIKGKNGKIKLNKTGELLAIERSRIVAGAIQKLEALRENIYKYKDSNNILVYCGATCVFTKDGESKTDTESLRQIEAVTRILGNDLDMAVAKFTADESIEQRIAIKDHFKNGKDLQAIVAIKCLDEGVNIPGIRTAFILASSTNPKEYIQRRGRVLRLADNKPYAEIYDFVTLPRPLDCVSGLTKEQADRDKSLVRKEVARMKEFGRMSMNSMVSNELILKIEETYHLDENEKEDEIYG